MIDPFVKDKGCFGLQVCLPQRFDPLEYASVIAVMQALEAVSGTSVHINTVALSGDRVFSCDGLLQACETPADEGRGLLGPLVLIGGMGGFRVAQEEPQPSTSC